MHWNVCQCSSDWGGGLFLRGMRASCNQLRTMRRPSQDGCHLKMRTWREVLILVVAAFIECWECLDMLISIHKQRPGEVWSANVKLLWGCEGPFVLIDSKIIWDLVHEKDWKLSLFFLDPLILLSSLNLYCDVDIFRFVYSFQFVHYLRRKILQSLFR